MVKIVFTLFPPTGYSDLPGNKEESRVCCLDRNLLLVMANKHGQQFNRLHVTALNIYNVTFV